MSAYEYHKVGVAITTIGWQYFRIELWTIISAHAAPNRFIVVKIGLIKLAIGIVKP